MATTTTDPAIQQVIQAIQVFSRAPDKKQLADANSWLQNFQHSVQAWTTCNVLLMSPDVPDACKTFAAQTFRAKVNYDLNQLLPEQILVLRGTLVAALQHFAGGPRSILVQISLALSGLALQMEGWSQTAVQELIADMGTTPALVPGLLQFLAVLPDEIANTKCPLPDDAYKARAAQLLTANVDRVLELLVLYVRAEGVTPAIQNLVFECVRGWANAGELTAPSLAQTPLLGYAFEALKSDALFEEAADLICDIVHETQEIDDNMDVIQLIVPRLIALQPQLATLSDDQEKVRKFARMFSEAGETYRILILQHPETFMPLVQAISECAAYPDLEVVDLTFPFWYRLSQLLGKQREIPLVLQETYKTLFVTLVKHCHWPADVQSMTSQESDDFRRFRHDIGDVLKDCASVLGISMCLQNVYEILAASLQRAQAWQEVEGPLFCLRALGGKADFKQQDEIITKFMDLLPGLPPHPRVRYAATMLIGRYTEWTDEHPSYIPTHLTFISASFEDPDLEVVSAAGTALKYLCKDCKRHLVAYMDQLHQFLVTVGPKLMQEDKVAIYEAVAWIISSMPMEESAATLRKFAIEILSSIAAVVSQPSPPTSEENKNIQDGLEQLEHMLVVVGGYGEVLPEACQATAGDTWQVMDAVLQKYGNSHDISERVTRVLRHGLQLFDQAAKPYVPAMLASLTGKFEATGLANYVWIVGKVVDRFGVADDSILRAAITSAFERVTAKFTAMCTESSIGMHSDVAEDYLFVVTPLVEYNPDILFLSPAFSASFTLLASSLQLFHTDTIFRSLGLIRSILGHDALNPATQPPPANATLYAAAVRDAIQKDGLALVGYLFAGLLDHFQPETMSGVITTVRILTMYWPAEMQQWVPLVLGQLQVPPAVGDAKLRFLNEYGQALARGDLDLVKPALSNLQRSALRAKDRRRGFDRI